MPTTTLYRNSLTGEWQTTHAIGNFDVSVTIDNSSIVPNVITCPHTLTDLIKIYYDINTLGLYSNCSSCGGRVNLQKS